MSSNGTNIWKCEAAIKGEARLKYKELKDGSKGEAVCNLGFPLDTTEQEGMDHKDCWMPTVCYGQLAEWLESRPQGMMVHVEGPIQANRWTEKDTGIEKMTMHCVIKRAGELTDLGKEPIWFVPVKRERSGDRKDQPVRTQAEKIGAQLGKMKPEVLQSALDYLKQHDQNKDPAVINKTSGPGEANAGGTARPDGVGPGGAG